MEMGNTLCFSLAGSAGFPAPRSPEAEHQHVVRVMDN